MKERRYYRGTEVTMRHIRAYVRRIVERFAPDKVILFGSQAYGTPHADSDVDLLVVMPCRNELDQMVKISYELEAPFSLDIIVRKPKVFEYRIREGDWFLREVVAKGKVMYARKDEGVDRIGGGRPVDGSDGRKASHARS